MEGTGLNCDYTVCMQGECFNVRCKSCKPPSPPPHPTNHHGCLFQQHTVYQRLYQE